MDIQQSAPAVRGQRIGAAIVDYSIFQMFAFIASLFMIPFIGLDALMDAALGILEGGEPDPAFIQYTVMSTLSGLLIGILYYGYIPWKKNGMTFGKMFFHIKAIDTNGEPLPFSRHLFRAIMLYGIFISTPLLLLILVDPSLFMDYNVLLSYFTFGIVILSFLLVLTRSDSRGVNDFIANSYVVDEKYSNDSQSSEDTETKDPLGFNYDAWENTDDSWS